MISSLVRALISAFKARRELALENVALRQQLAVCIVKTAPPTKSRTYAPLEFRAEDGETPPVPSIYSSASPWVGSQPCGAKYPGFCADSKGV